MRFDRTITAFLGLALLAAGCATPPPESDLAAVAEYEQINDPAEPTNRAIFDVNKGLDDVAIKPVAEGYRDYVPQTMRNGIRSFLTNLGEPWTFVNEIMQGEFERSGETLGRFCVNSTAGVLGFMDIMGPNVGPAHQEDFGQTLGAWGVGEGPYMVLPVLGPSNPRDAVGTAVDYIADPASLALGLVMPAYATISMTVVGGIDKREKFLDQLNDVERTSLDYYASLRSLYRQKRESDIRNGKPDSKPQLLNFDDGGDFPASPAVLAPAASPPSYLNGPSPGGVGTVDDERRRMDELVKSMRSRVQDLRS